MNIFTQSKFTVLEADAQDSPRKRVNLNVHSDLSEPIQRLFISVAPGTYVRPHRHNRKDKFEFFLVVSGSLELLIFNDDGKLESRYLLNASGEVKGLEIPSGTFHTVLPGDAPATFLEVKPGPYEPVEADELAPWAPKEGDEGVASFLTALSSLQVGQRICQ